MSEDKLDYGEVLCEAVDTIISKKLENLAYDITKTCIVIDDTYKKQGKYTVADGALKFEAYSTITTLNINDNVLVSIPNGDYNNQKTILNKVIYDNKTTTLDYVSPLKSMLKFTDNIINTVEPQAQLIDGNFSILANKTLDTLLYRFKTWDEYAGLKRLGISANFHTRMNQYKVISGDYGIKIQFVSDTRITEFKLSTNDMNGNPYQFDTFLNQSKVFDISDLKGIKEVCIYLYQDNHFIDEFDNYLPTKIEGDDILGIESMDMDNNIFVNNIEIYLGYPIEEFNGDLVEISTPGDIWFYGLNDIEPKKILNVRWIHQIDENTYKVFTEKDIYKENIKVYWFRYTLNQSSNEVLNIAGEDNWSMSTSLINQSYDGSIFKSSFEPDYDKTEERIRVVCSIPNEFGEEVYYRSKDYVFTNRIHTVDKLTLQAAMGLTIHCLDKSEGNYFIYNQSGKIINEGQGQGFERHFEVLFNGKSLNDPKVGLTNITEITWTLPIDTNNANTMLTYSPEYFSNNSEEIDKNSDYIIFKRFKDENTNTINSIQSYSIKNTWHSANSSNIIKCKVRADNIDYEAKLELSFGKASSSGTNMTLILQLEDNANSIPYFPKNWADNAGSFQPTKVKALLYDMAGNRLGFKGSLNWSWLYESNDFIIIDDKITEDKTSIQLTPGQKFDILNLDKNYHILKVVYEPEGSTTITSYLPIAFSKIGKGYRAEGAREVIYDSQGVPSYYTDAYILYSGDTEEDVEWALDTGGNENSLVQLNNLTKEKKTYKALVASPIYVKDSENLVCVYAYNEENEILWSQPVLIMQSQYDYATLNEWSGSTKIDDNFIMSSMLGVGRKDGDNTFSGIIIGDIEDLENKSADEKRTGFGLYGLTQGAITFSLTDKGIVTFGDTNDPDTGHVILSKTENLINSANGNYYLDINKGYQSLLYKDSGSLYLGDIKGVASIPNNIRNFEKNYLTLIDKNSKPVLEFTETDYKLQSYLDNDTVGLLINLKTGLLSATNKSNKVLKINDPNSYAIEIGDFKINWDGKATAINSSSLKVGSAFEVTSNGAINIGGVALDTYINNLISKAQNTNPST